MQHLTGLVAQHGVALVFANVLLVQLGVPLPAVPTLIVAGSAAGLSTPALATLVGAAVLASLAGDVVWYYAGRRYGYRVLNALCSISISPDSCVRRTETIFERWGVVSLIAAKFVPGFATVAPPLAGAMALALAPFLFYSAIGAALWAAIALVAGAVFESEVALLLDWTADMGLSALALAGLVLAAFIAFKWWQRERFLRELRMARIGVDELQRMMEQGREHVVLDVRSQAARQLDARRIPGALAIDFDDPDADLGGVPVQYEIILYCT